MASDRLSLVKRPIQLFVKRKPLQPSKTDNKKLQDRQSCYPTGVWLHVPDDAISAYLCIFLG